MDDFEKELKTGFLEEAHQLLIDSEQCFLSLERNSQDQSVIEQIFRLAHNLKGSAGAVGFTQVAEFTHKFESLILKFKKKELQINSVGVSLLLRCNDHLREMIDGLQQNMDSVFDSQSLMQELADMIEGRATLDAPLETESTSPPPAEAFDPPQETQFEAQSTTTAESIAEFSEATQVVDTQNQKAIEEIVSHQTVSSFKPISQQELEAVINQFDEANFISEADFKNPSEPIAEAPKMSAPAEPAPQPVVAKPVVENTEPAKTTKSPQSSTQPDESIRVSLSKLDTLINYVGEMVILQTVLNQNRSLFNSQLLQRTVGQLAKISKNIQEISMGLRMIPVKSTFQKMHRIVRDTSQKLGKQVELHLVGEETELDKTVLEHIGDPLVHLIRNAVDHGLESTETRVAKGKSEIGNVYLRAFHKGGRLVIEVQDDGGGIDGEKLWAKAVEKGVVPAGKSLSDKEKVELVFAAGFSTKQEVTDISGRGVGMDVVRTNIRNLEGEVEIDTKIGEGTVFRISLPLTLAIIESMVVKLANEKLILPLTHVHESLRPQEKDITFVQNMGQVLTLRGEAMPLYSLSALMGSKLGKPKTDLADMTAIVIRVTGEPFAVLVDEIIGQQQVVVKRLGPDFPTVKGISGTAILGDGKAALIVDLPEISKSNSSKGAKSTSQVSMVKGVA